MYELVPAARCDVLVRTDSPSVSDWFNEGYFTVNPFFPFFQSNEYRITVVDDLSQVINERSLLQLDSRETSVF